MLAGLLVVVLVESAGLAPNKFERDEVVVVVVVVSVFGFVASVVVVPKLNPLGAVVELVVVVAAGLEPKLKPDPDDIDDPRPDVVLEVKLDNAGVDAEVKEEPRVEVVPVLVEPPKLNAG